MRLAILNITAGGMSGGHKKYLQNLLPRISSNAIIEEIVCTIPRSLHLNNICDNSRVKFKEVSHYSIMNHKLYGELRQILDKFIPDVIYVPVERFFPYENAPVVTMLQNMEPFVCPFSGNPPFEKIKNCFRITNSRKALRSSDRIIAISEFVRNYLITHLHIDSHKIGLVYHGIDKHIAQPKKPDSIPETCDKFLFTAGSIRPARGLEDVLESLRYLVIQNVNVSLVVAGNADRAMLDYQRRLKHWLNENNLLSNVIWAGSLDESEMAWCYQNCTAFIMTSRVEACPNIALEAMAYGCICVSTETRPMPEIFGDAAIYYNFSKGKALCSQIYDLLFWDESQKRTAMERAVIRAARFSWDICAEKTVSELLRAIGDFSQKGG